VAVGEINDVGIERIGVTVRGLAERVRGGVGGIEGTVFTDGGEEGPIVAFELETRYGITADVITATLLKDYNIGVSASPSKHSFDEKVWERVKSVRVSPAYFNTGEEIDRLVEALKQMVAGVAVVAADGAAEIVHDTTFLDPGSSERVLLIVLNTNLAVGERGADAREQRILSSVL